MLVAALASSALSTVVFILAPNVGVLFAGRILSGLSAGLMTGPATATLTELIPASASRRASLVATAVNMGGLGLGPLIAGLFAQYAPHPTVLVFVVYLAVLAAAGLCLFLVPETVSPRQRPALRFAGLSIPERGRGEFVAAGVAGFAAFSLLWTTFLCPRTLRSGSRRAGSSRSPGGYRRDVCHRGVSPGPLPRTRGQTTTGQTAGPSARRRPSLAGGRDRTRLAWWPRVLRRPGGWQG